MTSASSNSLTKAAEPTRLDSTSDARAICHPLIGKDAERTSTRIHSLAALILVGTAMVTTTFLILVPASFALLVSGTTRSPADAIALMNIVPEIASRGAEAAIKAMVPVTVAVTGVFLLPKLSR